MITTLIFAGFVLLKVTEKITTKLVERERLKEFQLYIQDNPGFILVPQKIYNSPLRQRIAEGGFPATEERRLEEQKAAEANARRVLSLIPEEQLRQLLEQTVA
jgi:hypothetical protein